MTDFGEPQGRADTLTSPTELLAQYNRRLRDSFPFFLSEVWRFRGLPQPSRFQIDMAHWLSSGPKKRGILAWRGSAKTWMTAAYICWRWRKDPELKVLLVYGNEQKGKDTLRMVRDWLDMIPFLRDLAPTSGRVDNTEQFDLGCCKRGDRTTSMLAVGIDGTLPGARAGLIIADDVEHPKNVITHDMRVKLRDKVTELENILLPGGEIVYLGTYHHPESLYDALQKPDPERAYTPYKFRTWPIEYPSPDITTPTLTPLFKKDIAEGKAQPGEPTWPERFSKQHILGLVMGRTKFLQQYMLYQDPASSNAYPLRLADLIVYPVNKTLAPATIQWGLTNHRGSTAIEDIPSTGFGDDMFHAPVMVAEQYYPYVGNIGYFDPAGRGEDESAFATGGQLHGYIFAKRVEAFSGGPTEANLERMVMALREDHIHEFYVEDTFGGDALIRLIEMVVAKHSLRPDPENTEFPNGWSAAVIPHHAQSRGQKEMWICDTLETVMTMHRLVIDPAIAKDTTLSSQITFITRERDCLEHDDRIEALAGMVSKFSDSMGQNPSVQSQRQKELEREIKLANYYKQFGATPKPKTWSGLS